MRTNATIIWLALWLGLIGYQLAVRAADEPVRPQGYRQSTSGQPYDRTYGGYWWIDRSGDICEEGITVQGNPLVCSRDTMLVLDATAAEVRDLHFVDGDIRRTWTHGGRATAVHVFTKQCPDSLVGSWGTYEPVFFRFRPGVLVEDIRRPGYTETLDTTHQVGALTYKAVRPKKSPLEVKQSWYVAGKWCVVGTAEMRNLTDQAEDAAALAVGLNLRSPVNLDRRQLDWFADFHSNGKAGVPMVPRLSDAEYQKLTEITKYHIEYRPQDRCFVARTGCDVRAPQPAEYFACLMLDSPVSRHVLADGGDVHQPALFTADKSHPQQLVTHSAAIGLRSENLPLAAGASRAVKYAIAFGKTADEAVAHARQGLGASAADSVREADAAWTRRLPAVTTGNAGLNAHLRYAAITQDVNWEPDGRAPGDLGGWGRQERAEVCGYKNYYDQDDMVVPILDMPVYDPDLFKKALLYDVDPQTGRLRKCGIWRQQYDNMLFWPCGVYKVWMATGDDAFLKQIYPALDKTLRWLRETRTEPDGLLRMLTMPYDMFTIGVGDDRPVMIRAQAVACDALQAMVRMAGHLNKAEDAAFYEQWLAQIKQAAREQAVASGVLQHEPRLPGAFQRLGQLLGDPGRALRRAAGEFDLPRNRQAVHRDRLPGTASAGAAMGRYRALRLPERRHVRGSTGADRAGGEQDARQPAARPDAVRVPPHPAALEVFSGDDPSLERRQSRRRE